MEGQKLRELINKSGYSVSEIAAWMETSQSALSHQMKRGCSEKYYEKVKRVINYMSENEGELEHVEVIDSAHMCGHVADFLNKMDVMFKQYKEDGCLDGYHRDGNFLTVGKKDASYMWAALDGAVHLYNMVHPGNELIVDNYRTTDVSETFIVQYVVDYE